MPLTHWGRVTHICVSKLTIIGSDNGLSPGRRQAIIWTNAGVLLIGPLGTNFSEILIKILTFSFKKMHLKMSSGKWRPSCLGLNVLSQCLATSLTGNCLIKAYDFTIQWYCKSHTEIKVSKMHILQCMCWKVSKVSHEISHKNTPHNMHFTRCQNFDKLLSNL